VPTFTATRVLIFALAVGSAVLRPSLARAMDPFLFVPDPGVAERTPAFRYANMSDAEALAELDRRRILYSRVERAPGVRAPIRLTGRLNGVYFHSSLPPEQRVTSVYEILDARLALALDDFALVLARHDIDEVVHYTMYRPNVGGRQVAQASPATRARATGPRVVVREALAGKAVLEGSPKGQRPGAQFLQKAGDDRPKVEFIITRNPPVTRGRPAAGVGKVAARPVPPPTVVKRASPPPGSSWAPPGTRHPAGLAIDVALLRKRDGRWLSVGTNFLGHIGDKTCGDGVKAPDAPNARELRSIVCEASDLGIFTYVLTPNYNAAHHDHFHMEIKPGVRWFLYH
jgi:hypothetical protein